MCIRTLAIILATFTTIGCSSTGREKPAAPDPNAVGNKTFVLPAGEGSEWILSCSSGRIEYTPIPALPAGGYTRIEIDRTTNKPIPINDNWPDLAKDVNKLLTNISTNISQSTKDISVKGGIIWFSGSRSEKQYVIDFMKWRAEPLYTQKDKQLGWVRVGAGMRVVVNITKSDGSATGSLLSLAVSARAGKVDGSISTELIGVDSKEVTQAMPFSVDLSEGNIQKVIEALAIVKTKLYDDNTTLSPNLIAKIQCAPLEDSK